MSVPTTVIPVPDSKLMHHVFLLNGQELLRTMATRAASQRGASSPPTTTRPALVTLVVGWEVSQVPALRTSMPEVAHTIPAPILLPAPSRGSTTTLSHRMLLLPNHGHGLAWHPHSLKHRSKTTVPLSHRPLLVLQGRPQCKGTWLLPAGVPPVNMHTVSMCPNLLRIRCHQVLPLFPIIIKLALMRMM